MSTAPIVISSIDAVTTPRLRWPWKAPALALVLVVALQLVYFTGVVSSDDVGYLWMVWTIQEGRVPTSHVHSQVFARFVHWELIRAAVTPLPHEPWAMALPSMAAMTGVLAMLGGFVWRHIDRRLTFVAVLAFGLVPLNVVLASTALPENVATAFGFGAVCLVAGPLLERGTRGAAWRCLLAGLLLGAGFNAKETIALFGPGLVLFVLLCRTRYRWAWGRVGLVAVGGVVWLVFETVLLWCWTNDWLYHLHVVSRSQEIYLAGEAASHSPGSLLAMWTEYLRWLADPRSVFGPPGMILLAGLLYGLFKRGSPLATLMACVVVPSLIYLSAGSTDLRQYSPIIHQPRYLVPLLPAMAVLAAMLVARLWKGGAWRKRLLACAGVLAGAASLVGPNELAGRWYNAQTFAAGYDLVAENAPGFDAHAKLVASGLGFNRFHGLPHWLDCPAVEMIWPAPPRTPEEWIERYGGAYVIATRTDRVGPARAKHDHLTLRGEPMTALSTFELVARREPPRDRLSTLWAQLRGRPVPTDPEQAVELWRVPVPAR